MSRARVDHGRSRTKRRRTKARQAALRAAGVDLEEQEDSDAWDEDRVAKAIRRYARGGRRVSASWVREADPALYRAALGLMGSWNEAIRAAGLDPRDHRTPERWSLDRVKTWVRETHAAGGDIRSIAAPAGARSHVFQQTDYTWIEFVESLGIPYPGPKKRLDWTDEVVVAEIRRRRRRGLPLNSKAVECDVGQALLCQARKRFGSWDEALRRAGLDPVRIRRRATWTRERVIAAIRARAKAGRSLRRKDVLAEDPRLVKAAKRMFPSSWRRALEAAGLARGRGRNPRRRP